MNEFERIDYQSALVIFEQYKSYIEMLEAQGRDYCVVGGLAVAIQEMVADRNQVFSYRLTQDIDLLVSNSYTNEQVLSDYNRLYNSKFELNANQYGSVEELDKYAQTENISISGLREDIDGSCSPDIDVTRVLNGRRLATIKRERVVVNGLELWVATVPELLSMKNDTINMLHANILETSRPQDYLDIRILQELLQQRNMKSDSKPTEKKHQELINRIRDINPKHRKRL